MRIEDKEDILNSIDELTSLIIYSDVESYVIYNKLEDLRSSVASINVDTTEKK